MCVCVMSPSMLSSRLLLLGLTTTARVTCVRPQRPGRIFRGLSSGPVLRTEEKATIHFINRDGRRISVNSSTGVSLLHIVVDQNLDFEGFGACEGTLACSTCHLIFQEDVYKKLQDSITDEENDMLDLAYGLTSTSRLGCQVCLSKDLDGMIARVPDAVSDARENNEKNSAP